MDVLLLLLTIETAVNVGGVLSNTTAVLDGFRPVCVKVSPSFPA